VPLSLLVALSALSAALPSPSSLRADDVHLINGNTFEGVIATVDGDEVRIRLAHGEIALPASRVLRIDKHGSALQEYLQREQALFSTEAGATEWLELARWARARDLDHGAKQSALRAARLDPRLEGLDEVLGAYGYLFDQDSGRWLTYEESMERRGFVYYQGGWVHRSDLEQRLRLLEQEATQRRAARAEATAQLALEAAIEARVQAEVAREMARTTVQHPGLIYGAPAVVGSFFLPVVHHGAHPSRDRGHHGQAAPRDSAPRSASPENRSTVPRQIENVFAPPAGQLLQERDHGGRLGIDLPNGYGGAPGRLRHQP